MLGPCALKSLLADQPFDRKVTSCVPLSTASGPTTFVARTPDATTVSSIRTSTVAPGTPATRNALVCGGAPAAGDAMAAVRPATVRDTTAQIARRTMRTPLDA